MFVSALISVVPFIGWVAGEFCIVPGVLAQFAVFMPVFAPIVPVVPGAVVVDVLVVGEPLVVVVLPLFTVELVDEPLVVVVVFGVVLVEPGPIVVVADDPGGQFCMLVFVFVVGVVVVVVGVVVVLGVVGVVVVCANAGTAMLATSPATEAKPRIARELMR